MRSRHQSNPTIATRRARRLVAMVAAIVVGGILAPATTLASPARPGPAEFSTGFFDQHLGPSEPKLFGRATSIGAQWVRIQATWASIAPTTRPKGFHASDPSSPGYDWTNLDATLRLAASHRLSVLLTIVDAPTWAEGAHRPTSANGTWRPRAPDLGAFAHAVAERYSGTFPDPLNAGAELPKVTHLQVWNEPNYRTHLEPQWREVGKHYVPESPSIYRPMLNDAYAAIKSAQPHAVVFSAGTGPYLEPFSAISPPTNADMAPVTFLRTLLCLGAKLQPESCPHPVHLDALDHHPYSQYPNVPAALPGDVSVPDIVKLERIVAAARKYHRVLPAGPKPFWITEIDWPSDPPINDKSDPDAVPVNTQARYLSLAFYTLWRQNISHVMWFLIDDVPHLPGFGGAGVYFSSGKAKPAAQAFRFPFVAIPAGHGEVTVWGRAPSAGRVAIQHRIHGRWSTITTLRTTSGRVLYGKAKASHGTLVRARIAGISSVSYAVR